MKGRKERKRERTHVVPYEEKPPSTVDQGLVQKLSSPSEVESAAPQFRGDPENLARSPVTFSDLKNRLCTRVSYYIDLQQQYVPNEFPNPYCERETERENADGLYKTLISPPPGTRMFRPYTSDAWVHPPQMSVSLKSFSSPLRLRAGEGEDWLFSCFPST